jgi:micrococcal nuclease
LVLLVVLYLADDHFQWGFFASPTPTVRTYSTSAPSQTRVPSLGEPTGLPADAVAAEVVSVADGDTIRVNIATVQYSVRLIGIDTPETYTTRTGYAECWGKEASNFTRRILAPGTIVYLERDRSDTDQYGRLVRYVWVDAGAVGLGEAGSMILFNEVLVRAGYAIPYPYYPDTRDAARLATPAEAAQREGSGIW